MPNAIARSLGTVKRFWVFVSLGSVAQVCQIVLLRELLTLAEGTELTIAFVLGAWLIFTAIGSVAGSGGRISRCADWLFAARRTPQTTASLALLYGALSCVLAICVAGELFALRHARLWLGLPPGEPLSVGQWLIVATLALFPICVILGAQFVIAATLTQVPSLVYIAESVGAIVAGMLLSLVLFYWLDHTALLALFLSAHLLSSLGLLWQLGVSRFVHTIMFSGIASGLLISAPFGEHYTQYRFWQSLAPLRGTLRLTTSPYGTVALVSVDGQYSIYQNGQLLFTLPDEGDVASLVHLILLQHPRPSRVLVIGGVGGWVQAVLKHPTVTLVDWVELDPTVPRLLLHMLPPSERQVFSDPRLVRHTADGRAFVRRIRHPYDVIMVVAGDPTTAALNRYYTREFFNAVFNALTPGGIFALHGLREPPMGFGAFYLARNHCVYTTMRSAFCSVFVIPSHPLTLLGRCPGPENYPITLHEPTLLQRAAERGLSTETLNFPPLTDLVQVERVTYELTTGLPFNPLEREKAKPPRSRRLNTDANPTVFFLSSLLWVRMSSEPLAKLLEAVARCPWWGMGLLLTLAVTGTGQILRRRQPHALPLIAVALIGAVGMATEISILLSFQSLFGTLYHQVGLLFALFMSGLAVGAGVADRIIVADRALTKLLALTGVVVAAWWGCSWLLERLPAFVSASLCGISMLVIGGLVGAAFPLTLRTLQQKGAETPQATGLTYACDLVGGAVGAFLLGAIMLPLYGTTFLLGISTFLCLLLAVLMEREQRGSKINDGSR